VRRPKVKPLICPNNQQFKLHCCISPTPKASLTFSSTWSNHQAISLFLIHTNILACSRSVLLLYLLYRPPNSGDTRRARPIWKAGESERDRSAAEVLRLMGCNAGLEGKRVRQSAIRENPRSARIQADTSTMTELHRTSLSQGCKECVLFVPRLRDIIDSVQRWIHGTVAGTLSPRTFLTDP